MFAGIQTRMVIGAVAIALVAITVVSVATAAIASRSAAGEFEKQIQIATEVRDAIQGDIVSDDEVLVERINALADANDVDITLVDNETNQIIAHSNRQSADHENVVDPGEPSTLR